MIEEKHRTEKFTRPKKINDRLLEHLFDNKLYSLVAAVTLCIFLFTLILFSRYFANNFSRKAYIVLSLLFMALFLLAGIISCRELYCGISPLFFLTKAPNRYTPVALGCFFVLLYYIYASAKLLINSIPPDFTLLSVCILSLVSVLSDSFLSKKADRECLIDNDGKNNKDDTLTDSFSGYYCPYVLMACTIVFTISVILTGNIERAVVNTLTSASLISVYFISSESLSVYIAMKRADTLGISFANRAAFFKISKIPEGIDIISDDSGDKFAFCCNETEILIYENNRKGNYDLMIREAENLKDAMSIARSAVITIKANHVISLLSYLTALMIGLFVSSENAILLCIFSFCFVISVNLLILKKRLDNIKKDPPVA